MSERIFTLEEQHAFARLSGDSNPVHIDPLRARRSQFGRPIVHGMHLLLWAMEQCLASAAPSALSSLKCTLRRSVGIDEKVDVRIVEQTEANVAIRVECRGAECATFELTLTAAGSKHTFVDRDPDAGECREYPEQALAGAQGSLPVEMNATRFSAMFPVLYAKVPLGQVATILATTRLVGMECPGLHSIYSDVSIDFTPSPGAPLSSQMDWFIDDYDDRFRRVGITFATSGGSGTISAMLRPAPQKQPTTHELSARLPRAAMFSGQRALVVGGSRGLGELCAKLLAAGGADVCITYHRGRDDAESVATDIRAAGGSATVSAYDIFDASRDLQERLGAGWCPSHVYYFPTPPIFVAARGKFESDIFANFCRYYVEGFQRCWAAARALTAENLVMFYPSSVAVETVYSNMGEYAAAKAAGESLCRFLSACDRKLRIRVDRLPRLPSDQTLSVVEVECDDPVETLLSFIDVEATVEVHK